MRRWDYLPSPSGTAHITVGAGEAPCAIMMFGSPASSRKVEWIAHEVAAKHGVSVERARSLQEGVPLLPSAYSALQKYRGEAGLTTELVIVG